ncbi:YrbL family protein [Allohahella marinimesophila]
MNDSPTPMPKLDLGPEDNAFAQGGNRLCFIHPDDPVKCVKTLRKDRLPELKQKEKGLKGRLRKRSSFDDNQQEYSTFLRIADLYGPSALKFIPRCYGMVATNHGPGLVTDLIRDFDGAISMTLKQYVWIHGDTPRVKNCIAAFQQSWESIGLPSRNLLLHNIVVQLSAPDVICRLVVIDGLGWADVLPFGWWSRTLARAKAARKAERLNEAIEALLDIRRTNGEWGYHGWMEPAQRYAGVGERPASEQEK